MVVGQPRGDRAGHNAVAVGVGGVIVGDRVVFNVKDFIVGHVFVRDLLIEVVDKAVPRPLLSPFLWYFAVGIC